jgi:hypothetical protein
LDVNAYRLASHAEIYSFLHPSETFFFMQTVPKEDGWENDPEFRLAGDPSRPMAFLIRSSGCDGEFDHERYELGPFVVLDYAQDIVWADGMFWRWPETFDRGH